MLEEVLEQARHHPLEPQIPQVLDMPAVGSAGAAIKHHPQVGRLWRQRN